jgi:hypothetical protein
VQTYLWKQSHAIYHSYLEKSTVFRSTSIVGEFDGRLDANTMLHPVLMAEI